MKTGASSTLPIWLAWPAFCGGALNVIFWTLYGLRIVVPGDGADPFVEAFESAFPAADTALGIVLMITGLGLLQKRTYGMFCLIIAASMALYLGVLDLTFYLGRGYYQQISGSDLFLLLINAACLGGGSAGLWVGGKFWHRQFRKETAHA